MKKLTVIAFLLLLHVAAYSQTLSLEECLQAASENSVTVSKSALDTKAAKALRDEARWEYVPRLSVNAIAYDALNPLLKVTLSDVLGNSDAAAVLSGNITSVAYQSGIKPYYETLSHGYGATATLVQPLFAGGRIVNGNRLAGIGLDAASLQEELARKEVRDSVENKYWRIVALQEKEKTLQETMKLVESLEKDVQSALGAGLVTDNTLSELEMKKAQLEAGMYRLAGSLSLLKMDLLDYAGMEYNHLEISSLSLEGTLEDLPEPEEVIAGNPGVESSAESRLLDLQVTAKETEKRMAVGEYLPQLAVGASYGYNALMNPDKGTMNGMIFATLKIPVTDIGKASARAKRYNYAVQKAEKDREYLMSRLRLREGMCRLEVETLWKEISAAEKSVGHAEDNLNKVSARFKAGQATASDVLQANLSFTEAKETLLQKKTAYKQAVNAYLSCLGENGQ